MYSLCSPGSKATLRGRWQQTAAWLTELSHTQGDRIGAVGSRSCFAGANPNAFGYLTGEALRLYPVSRSAGQAGLGRARQVGADGRLKPRIEVEAPWTELGEIAARLIERWYTGKSALRVSGT